MKNISVKLSKKYNVVIDNELLKKHVNSKNSFDSIRHCKTYSNASLRGVSRGNVAIHELSNINNKTNEIRITSLLKEVIGSNKTAIITDDIVDKLYSKSLIEELKANGFETYKYVFSNGEESKNINTLSDILEFLAENNFKRNNSLIALGGGVVGDITGLSAAIYMRGINFIQIPTTLLAMVDASIGGKTAIDLKHGKNLAGAFWQPSLVICDSNIIKELPEDIFSEGMAEVIKCGAIRENSIIDFVLNNKVKENIENIIEACISLKRDVVEQDEYETKGIRQILNVGHTFAHAIEKLSNFKITHGKAVGTGLVIEAKIAKCLDILKDNTDEIIKACVDKYSLYQNEDYEISSLIKAMKNDKKNNDNKITFVLPRKLNDYTKISIDENELKPIFERIL
jgi:3-dehydroquinate synthase